MKKIKAFLKCGMMVALLTGSQYLVALAMVAYKYITTDLSYEQAFDYVLTDNAVAVTYISAALTIGVIWLISKLRKKTFSEYIDWGKNIRGTITYACVLVGIGGNFWTTIVMNSIFSQQAVEEYNAASGNMSVTSSYLALIGVAILVPIMEEIVFRGVMLSTLSKVTSVELAIILQGIIFGLMHGDIIWICYAVFMGLILGYIRVCTGSLKAAIVMHMAYNIASPIASIIMYSFMGTSSNPELIILLTGTFLMISGLITIYKYQPE